MQTALPTCDVDRDVLDLLTICQGAILSWQVPNWIAFNSAEARGVIRFDPDTDCYVHPLAIDLGNGAWEMPEPPIEPSPQLALALVA